LKFSVHNPGFRFKVSADGNGPVIDVFKRRRSSTFIESASDFESISIHGLDIMTADSIVGAGVRFAVVKDFL